MRYLLKALTCPHYIDDIHRKYNDISAWHWTSLLNFFGADPSGAKSQSYTVKTKTELSDLLKDPKFASAEKIQLVEIMMDKFDAPRSLKISSGIDGKWED